MRTGQSLILHRGAAVQSKATGDILDRGKKRRAQRAKMRDELTGGAASAGGGSAGPGGETRLSYTSKQNLGNVAKTFVESCFNRKHLIRTTESAEPSASVLLVPYQGYPSRKSQSHRER